MPTTIEKKDVARLEVPMNDVRHFPKTTHDLSENLSGCDLVELAFMTQDVLETVLCDGHDHKVLLRFRILPGVEHRHDVLEVSTCKDLSDSELSVCRLSSIDVQSLYGDWTPSFVHSCEDGPESSSRTKGPIGIVGPYTFG